MNLNRRNFLTGASAAAAALALTTMNSQRPAFAGPVAMAPDAGAGIDLHWLDGRPAATTGASWGVPWPRGQVRKEQSFALSDDAGKQIPVQSWPLAYWPDGTVKWSGHAVGSTAVSERFHLAPGASAAPTNPVAVEQSGGEIKLTTGNLDVRLAVSGATAIKSITRGGRLTGQNGRLVLLLQDKPEMEDGARRTSWTGIVERAEIEQSGPVRAVVKLSGRYQQDKGPNYGNGDRAILPWTMRVYLNAGDQSLRVVHNFIWDADPSSDFVRGLGMELSVPLTDEAHNRHIRFGTDSGNVWAEPVRVLTGLRRDAGAAVRAAQIAGTATPPVSQWSDKVRDQYQQLPIWNDFTIFQDSPKNFSVWKRTTADASWIKHAGQGVRASGFGYVGGISGGLGVGMRDFWQRFPRAIDVRGAGGDTATMTLWSWSPLAGPMDLRHYDTTAHGLDLTYEDVQPGNSTPTGISRSTEMELWAFDATPNRDTVVALSTALNAAPQVVATPQWYHDVGVFGRWSLPDRSTPARAALEDSIDHDMAFYAGQIDQREWYGFWNYGDVMHTYDADRHTWRYDVGGFAWDNAELGSDAMLWYSFLRSGQPATFRMAKAMTQHVIEVDNYHAGQFAGLGTRHNVTHWGDGAKEARVAESYTKRFSYYLTADELLGDLIRSSLQADQTLVKVDPLREVLGPQNLAPTRIRVGPDWIALVSNWMTEWERTGDTKWRDRIVVGMQDLAGFPAGLFTGESGGAIGFDPETGHLSNFNKGDFSGVNLTMAFCGAQILWEALTLVDVPEFQKALVDYGRYCQAPASEKVARYGKNFPAAALPMTYAPLTAWAGEQLNDPAIRQRGWQAFLADPNGKPWPASVQIDGNVTAAPVQEIPAGDISTNNAAQRVNAISSLLAIAPSEAP